MIVAYALIAMARTEDVDHEFVFRANEKLQHVSLAGSFNGWNKDADPMALSPDGVTWKKRLRLKPGAYTYKFVLNGDRWIVDPKAKRNVDDGNGNTNSQVVIAPTTFAKSAVKGDGAITVSALKALTDPPYLNVDRGKLSLWLRTRSNDVAQVSVQVKGVGSIPMADVEGDDLFERYSAKVGWDRKHDLRYRFVLDDGKGSMVFGPAGLTPLADRRCAGFGNSYIVRASTFHPFVVPNWVEHSIIYQIFPDRFANGDKANDPPNVQAWDSRPSYNSYLGGDIAGIEGRLPYLKWLGVSTIYFNPVFLSPSYHRYETADYFKIDPIFGTNEEFIKLVGDLKRLGIRTVLDGVFNHTATTFPAFADVVKNGKDSKFTDWYTFKSFPVRITRNPNYLAWSNFASMPKLNYGNPDVRKYVLSVPDYWQSKAGIAGWRLDAGDEVAHDFWRAFRSKVKSLDKNAWIL